MSGSSEAAGGTELDRLRFFEYRVDPIVWVLFGLVALDLVFEFATRGFDPLLVPVQLVGAAPIAFAGAVVLVARSNRLAVAGSLAVACGPLVWLAAAVVDQLLPELRGAGLFDLPREYAWVITLAGTLALGLSLGGIRSRVGWAAVLVGVVIVLVDDAWYLNYQANLGMDLPVQLLVSSLVAPVRFVGWAFLLGSALDRGYRLIAFGAGLSLATAAASWLVTVLNLITPAVGSDPWNAAFALIGLGAWAALIYGAVTELQSAGWSYPASQAAA